MRRKSMTAVLFTLCMILSISAEVYAQGAKLTGTWQVKSDKEPGISTLKLIQSGEDFSGIWQSAHGDALRLQNGKIVGETLTFSFTRDTHHIDATGHLRGDTMSLDITGHKWGLSKTVHRTATRVASN